MTNGRLLSIPTLFILALSSLFSFASTASLKIGTETSTEDAWADETTSPFDYDEAHSFVKSQMKKYGYLKKHSSLTEFQDALKNFQEVLEVEETGNVDEETFNAASKPRCAQSDIIHASSRSKRFALSKRSKWHSRHSNSHDSITLTWFISEYTTDMSPVETRRIVKKAFDLWSSQSHIKNEKKFVLNFEEAPTKDSCDINILWATGNHGDDYAFDGTEGSPDGHKQSNVLAHTFFPGYAYPLNGDIHFDDSETWESDVEAVGGPGNRKRFFPYVLAHEIGHALGLDHSLKSTALMHPYYKNIELSEIKLSIDDKCGVLWNFNGSSNFCLYVWLMSQVVEVQSIPAQRNERVRSLANVRNGQRISSFSKTAKCTASNVERITRRNFQDELQLKDDEIDHYTTIMCNFLSGLQLWKTSSQYSPIDSLEEEFTKNSKQSTLADGNHTFRRFIRHAKHQQERNRRSPLDEDFFNTQFFESFFAEYSK